MKPYAAYTKIYARPHFFENRGRRKQKVAIRKMGFTGERSSV